MRNWFNGSVRFRLCRNVVPDTSKESLCNMPAKSVVLTDVANGVWLDEFRLGSDCGLQMPGSAEWSISKRTLRGGVSEGVDVIEVDNGLLSVSVLPTRGMGLWRGRCGDVELGWQSPVALPVNPRFVNLTERNGLGWLAGFNEWLCRCGLASNGAPGIDVVRDNQGNAIEVPLTLHGKIANTPAHRVQIDASTDDSGRLSVTGVVDETMMFGPCLRLRSQVVTGIGSNRLEIIDEVVNLSGQAAELELLYHTNIGPPLLEAGSQFVAPVRDVAPSNPRAAEGIEHWQLYEPPTSGNVEQCYFVDLATNPQEQTLVLLRNAAGDLGISLHFNRRQLPCFTLWKNTQAVEDGYVTGLEPSTSLPNLKTFERQQGRVTTLDPGAAYESRFEIAIHATADEVAAVEREIEELAGDARVLVHRQPQADRSPLS